MIRYQILPVKETKVVTRLCTSYKSYCGEVSKELCVMEGVVS